MEEGLKKVVGDGVGMIAEEIEALRTIFNLDLIIDGELIHAILARTHISGCCDS